MQLCFSKSNHQKKPTIKNKKYNLLTFNHVKHKLKKTKNKLSIFTYSLSIISEPKSASEVVHSTLSNY